MVGQPFTREELILCTYAARFNASDFGGADAINSLTDRGLVSINSKIRNIASMLDENNISRENTLTPLHGLPRGQHGRRTNWDVVSDLITLSREQHLAECLAILQRRITLPGELPTGQTLIEGTVCQVLVDRFERDPEARRRCIAHYGASCVACGLSFGETYGSLAEGFIHVHHLKPLHEIRSEYVVDPVEDLRPVCPNCHAVIHLGGACRSIDELKQLLRFARASGHLL